MKIFRGISNASDPEHFFKTEHLRKDLKGRTIRSSAVTLASQVAKFALRIASTIVVARLLTPEDYGLLGMVTIVTGFAGIFSDLGLSTAVIQKAEINHKQVSTLFWINILIGLTVACTVGAAAPVIAWFYNEPRLIEITLALSLNFIFGGLTVQHAALLKRQMRFAVLGQIQIVSMFVGVVTAIVSAHYGFGYWSLIFMDWANSVANAIGVWIACGWRPGPPKWDSSIKSMLAFGGNLTGFRVVNYFTRNLDNLLIGRYWGAQALGLYAKAYQLLLLPIQLIGNPMTSVAIPALSSLQSQPERYRSFYRKAILSIATLSMPIMAFAFVAADKLILVFLGQKWLETVILFRLLMPAAFVSTFYVATSWVYQSLGRTDRQFRIGLVTSAITSVLFLIGVRWGTVGVAAVFGLSQPILYLPSVIYCYKETPLTIADLGKALYKPAIASIGSAIILWSIQQLFLREIQFVVGLIVDILVYAFFYFGIWMILPDGRKTLLDLISATRK